MSNKLPSLMLSICFIVLLSLAISTASGAKTILDINGWATMQQKNLANNISSFNNATNTNGEQKSFPKNISNINNNTLAATAALSTTLPSSTNSSTSSPASIKTTVSNATSSIQQPQNSISNKTNELQKKIQVSIPTYLILVDLNMSHKNTTDYGLVDLTVTLNNATKVKSLNSTSFSGSHVVMPFRFSAKSDNAPIQINDKFNTCASGEFLAAAVCNTGIIKTTNPPLTKADINLG
ncbi:MAG TPA: hypothetical protein VIY08_08050 [Candidatus Nitrosocosmicus sp.]